LPYRSGFHPQGSRWDPLDATTSGTYTPSPADLFMNSGDHLQVAFKDTPNGLNVVIHDLTTGQSGSMTASKANGFAQIKFAPTGTSCTAIPYNSTARCCSRTTPTPAAAPESSMRISVTSSTTRAELTPFGR